MKRVPEGALFCTKKREILLFRLLFEKNFAIFHVEKCFSGIICHPCVRKDRISIQKKYIRRKSMKKKTRLIVTTVLVTALAFVLTGCSLLEKELSEMQGSITGNTYLASFYSNDGEKFMTVSGENIDMRENIVRERVYTGDGWGYTKTKSSVITITIDGSEMASCGSTIIFAEKGLEPDVDYIQKDIESRADGSLGDYTFVANRVKERIKP